VVGRDVTRHRRRPSVRKLGFTVEEMVRCRTNSGGVVFIPDIRLPRG
jgi:hypothetical protein